MATHTNASIGVDNLLLSIFKDRLKNPFWSYLLIAEISWNWRRILDFILASIELNATKFRADYLSKININVSENVQEWAKYTAVCLAFLFILNGIKIYFRKFRELVRNSKRYHSYSNFLELWNFLYHMCWFTYLYFYSNSNCSYFNLLFSKITCPHCL